MLLLHAAPPQLPLSSVESTSTFNTGTSGSGEVPGCPPFSEEPSASLQVVPKLTVL
jgi:hypothetical protein